MRLTIHRGTHEIGGSCVEIRTKNAKVLIDLGIPLDYDKCTAEEQSQICYDATEWCKDVDAVFLSHAHSDHYGFFGLITKDTPTYATEETFAMMGLDGIFGTDHSSHLKRCTLQGYKTYDICGISVTCYPVDHSAFGACALLFEVDGKRILYSGDIRNHGPKGVLYKRLPKGVDYLLLEGTNISRAKNTISELDVTERFIKAFDVSPEALHLVWCSSKNIDRICAIFKACKRRNKQLLIDPYVANVLAEAAKLNPKIPSTTSDRIKIFFAQHLTTKLSESDKERYIYPLNPKIKKVTYDEISNAPGQYVMIVRPSLLDFIQRIKAEHIRLIRSIWSGYWGEPHTDTFRKWVKSHCEHIMDIHSSGHADAKSLYDIVEHIQPKSIVPIHTEQPELFGKLFSAEKIIYLDDNECLICK